MSKVKPHRLVPPIMSAIAAAFVIGHLVWPQAKVDTITLVLFGLGAAPWLYPFVKSVKLPGGSEIQLRDLEDATEKISTAEGTVESLQAAGEISPLEQVSQIDPNLAVAGLRINIEKIIRQIALEHGLANQGPLTTLVRTLAKNSILPSIVANGVEELVKIGNSAVHGGTLDSAAAEWAVRSNPQVLGSLRGYLKDPKQAL